MISLYHLQSKSTLSPRRGVRQLLCLGLQSRYIICKVSQLSCQEEESDNCRVQDQYLAISPVTEQIQGTNECRSGGPSCLGLLARYHLVTEQIQGINVSAGLENRWVKDYYLAISPGNRADSRNQRQCPVWRTVEFRTIISLYHLVTERIQGTDVSAWTGGPSFLRTIHIRGPSGFKRDLFGDQLTWGRTQINLQPVDWKVVRNEYIICRNQSEIVNVKCQSKSRFSDFIYTTGFRTLR